MTSDWSDRSVALASVPRDSLPMFGAQVGHDPAREAQDPATCPRCGGASRDDRGRLAPHLGADDPVKVYDHHIDEHGGAWLAPLSVTCGLCGRTPHDGTPALHRAVKPESGRLREGYQAPEPDTDRQDRTGAAVGTKGRPPAPPTRKERRAALYGDPKNPGAG